MTELLPVTQADRDAVQSFHRIMAARLMADLKSLDRPKLGEDEGDAGTLVQAFARHRLATAEAASGAGEREAALRLTVESEIETRFWSIVDQEGPTTVPSDMWNALQTIMNKCRRQDAALASLPPATDPAMVAGWKLVPVEPTSEQIDAGVDGNPTNWTDDTDDRFAYDVANDVYRAMVAAAPTIPATGHAATEGEG